MNERIKELAKEAGFEIDNGPLLPGLTSITMKVGGLYVGVPVEKFAELIVRECAEQSMSIGRYNTPSNITPDLSIAIAVGLKKHFGVEESKGWTCPKCGTDRTKQECPKGHTAALTGECPMIGKAQ